MIKIEPGCCDGKPKAKGGLMHLTADNRRPGEMPGEMFMVIIS